MLASIRQTFWIVKGLVAVRRVLRNCFSCRRRNATAGEQRMADLPSERLIPDQPPFTFVGVDYFGPVLVKHKLSYVKRYGCIFTCLTTRAIHIEIAHSLDTDSFISAMRRFIARRGRPQVVRSDNGTNFHAGEREIRVVLDGWNQQWIHKYASQQEIKWIFNPPAAAHMGGVWERLVRSVKKILSVLLSEQVVGDESLLTVVAEAESILNSRPSTQNPDDPTDAEPLTPNHLLMLKSNQAMPPCSFSKQYQYSRRRWRQVQYLADVFWRRWLREYLPTLQKRQRWFSVCRVLKEDDLFLIVDENIPRGQWRLGRVVVVHKAKDGHVRSAVIKTRSGHLTRPISKLCLSENFSLSA